MLAAMGERSFVVTIAYIKTEPVQVALFGLIFLGEHVTLPIGDRDPDRDRRRDRDVAEAGRHRRAGMQPTLLGLGCRRHVRALGDRLSRRHPQLEAASFVMAATFTLAVGLVMQAALLIALSRAARPRGAASPSRARGGRRCSPASWARSRRNSGSSPSRSPPRRACARWRWSRCCSRRPISRFVFKQPTSRARGVRHRADGARRRAADLGALKARHTRTVVPAHLGVPSTPQLGEPKFRLGVLDARWSLS